MYYHISSDYKMYFMQRKHAIMLMLYSLRIPLPSFTLSLLLTLCLSLIHAPLTYCYI